MNADEKNVGVADLQLSLYLRPIHPEFFTIRGRRSFAHRAFEAEVWTLEPGHVITFLCGPHALAEVVAPRDVELPKRGLARRTALATGREEKFEARGALLYHMAYQVDAERPETYKLEAEELLAGARHGHLFAESLRELARRQFSYAVPTPRARSLLVHTWHGFPAESTIVKTQTLIERVE